MTSTIFISGGRLILAGGRLLLGPTGAPPMVFGPGVGDGDNGRGGIPGGDYSVGSSWIFKSGVLYADAFVSSVVDNGSDTVAISHIGSTAVTYTDDASPWTPDPIAEAYPIVITVGSTHFSELDDGAMYYTTDFSTWTPVSAPSTWTSGISPSKLISDGTNLIIIFASFSAGTYTFKSAQFNGSSWDAPVTIMTSALPNFYAVTTATDKYSLLVRVSTGTPEVNVSAQLWATDDGGDSWVQDTENPSHRFAKGLVFSSGTNSFYRWNDSTDEIEITPISTFDGGTKDGFDRDAFTTSFAITMDEFSDNGVLYTINDPSGTVVMKGDSNYADGYFENFASTIPAYQLTNGTIYHPTGNSLTSSVFPINFVDSQTIGWSRDITYANGRYYAFFNSIGGEVLSTDDLTASWENSIDSSREFGGGLFGVASDGGSNIVAVGDFGTVVHSSDAGSTWTSVTSNTPQLLWDVVYGERFVAVGSFGGIVHSVNGSSWTDASIGGGDSMYYVAWGITPELYVAIGSGDTTPGGTWNYSSDGDSWTTITPSADCTWNQVRWLNDRFVGLGSGADGALIYSTNGTSVTFGVTDSTVTLYDAAYGNDVYVAVGQDTTPDAVIYYSSDGITWTPASFDNSLVYLQHVVYANDKFVAVGIDDNAVGSPQVVGSPEEPNLVSEVVTYTSTDGINWTKNATGIQTFFTTWLEWDGNQYLIATSSLDQDLNSNLYASALGTTTWSPVTTNVEGIINAVVAVNGKNVLAGVVGLLQVM